MIFFLIDDRTQLGACGIDHRGWARDRHRLGRTAGNQYEVDPADLLDRQPYLGCYLFLEAGLLYRDVIDPRDQLVDQVVAPVVMTTVRVIPVPLFTAVTETPGTTAPL